MRASSTLRGTLPGRNPGTRICVANVLATPPRALSNSGSSISTLRRTRFPSRVQWWHASRTAYSTGRLEPTGTAAAGRSSKGSSWPRGTVPQRGVASEKRSPGGLDCPAVVRPQPRRRKSMPERVTTAVAGTRSAPGGTSPVHADGELATILPGAGHRESHDRALPGAAAFLPTIKPMAACTWPGPVLEARPPLPPGRPRASRTSCSWTQLSNTRTS